MTRQIREVEILADFCGHLSPGWFPFECHVAILQIGNHLGLEVDSDIIIGEEAYLRETARLYIDAVLGPRGATPLIRRRPP